MTFGIVIVTYNRLELLKECLANVQNQILHYDHVIVVNNNSVDGTKEYLDSLQGDNVKIINLDNNTGGAGGFCVGVKEAGELGCEYITLIDDDAMLAGDFLQNMQEWLANHKDVMAVSGKVSTDGVISQAFARRIWKDNDTGKVYRYPVSLTEYEDEYFYCDEVTFCGLTFSKNLISKIGYPNTKFFTQYDDTDYSAKIRKYTKIALITSCEINHKCGIRSSSGPNWWRVYYSIRNEIYMVKKNYGIKAARHVSGEYLAEYNSYIRKLPYTKMRKRIILCAVVDAWLGNMGKKKWVHGIKE